jgi:hypothetical protein
MDAKAWGCDCESRPFADAYCTTTRRGEEIRFKGERRAAQLEHYMITERERQTSLQQSLKKVVVEIPEKPAKFDSVHSIFVCVEELVDGQGEFEG